MKKKTGLTALLIDMQRHFLNSREKKGLIPRQAEVLRACKRRNIPLIVIEYEGAGRTVKPLRDEFVDFITLHKIIKSDNNAFLRTRLEELLKEINARELLIMGVNACSCVFETVRHARVLGYEVVVSDDLIAGYCNAPACNSEYRHRWYQRNTHFITSYADVLRFVR